MRNYYVIIRFHKYRHMNKIFGICHFQPKKNWSAGDLDEKQYS